mmetsp:Transcript_26260/g.43541  ORF Transcript_26260/g.43541 Transcript_26260/m.43541 type:complete len:458 (+) Transcript_26260:201-1574(+)
MANAMSFVFLDNGVFLANCYSRQCRNRRRNAHHEPNPVEHRIKRACQESIRAAYANGHMTRQANALPQSVCVSSRSAQEDHQPQGSPTQEALAFAQRTKVAILVRSFTPSDSTPLDTSTHHGFTWSTAVATFSCVSPPARMKGAACCTASPICQSNVLPVPPPFESSSTAAASPPRIWANTASADSPASICTTLTEGLTSWCVKSQPSCPCSCIRSKSHRSATPFISSTVASTNTPTTNGPPLAAALLMSARHVFSHSRASAPLHPALTNSAASGVNRGIDQPSGRGRSRRTALMMARASSSLTCRFDFANIMPTRSAPAIATAAAASGSRSPQILHSGCGGVRSRSSRTSTSGDGARISDSPTRIACAPTCSKAMASARVETPERARSSTSLLGGTMAASRPVVPMSTVKVWRLRLLMPITRAPAASAVAISASVATSMSGSMPSSRENFMRWLSC